MFDILNKYKLKGHFTFMPEDSLELKCNAPSDKNGVYIIYALSNKQIDIVYIGCSGKMQNDGNINTRITGLGGLKGRIVEGHQFKDPDSGKRLKRFKSLPLQMKAENIEALDIYWYITFDNIRQDIPAYVEAHLLQRFFEVNSSLPRWNNTF